jgi:dynein heavy chain
LGSPVGKNVIVLVHNLELVNHNTEENSPYELLRQLIAERGFYDRRTLAFTKVQGFQIIASYNSDLNAEFTISQRLLQLFFVISLPAPSDETIKSIFSPLLKETLLPFSSSDLVRLKNPLLEATVFVFRSLSQHRLADDLSNRSTYSLHLLMQVFKGNKQLLLE